MTALARLSLREKVLLLVLFLVAVPLALWALILVPLETARDRAIADVAGAQADYLWVAEQAAQFDRTLGPAATPAVSLGIAALEDALVRSDLRRAVATLESAPSGDIRLQVKSVPFDVFGRFLDDLRQDHAFTLTAFRIEPTGAPGEINASLAFEPG